MIEFTSSNFFWGAAYVTSLNMPIPLSVALWAMNATKSYHSAPAFQRPFRLRKIYFARLFGYSLAFALVATPHVSSNKKDHVTLVTT